MYNSPSMNMGYSPMMQMSPMGGAITGAMQGMQPTGMPGANGMPTAPMNNSAQMPLQRWGSYAMGAQGTPAGYQTPNMLAQALMSPMMTHGGVPGRIAH